MIKWCTLATILTPRRGTITMPVEIRPITSNDIYGAARCIQEAFADDPYNNWVFDKSKVCSLSLSACPSETMSIPPA